MTFREGEQHLGGLFHNQGEVDGFWDERLLVNVAEKEQCFGEVDRSGIDGVKAVDEFAGSRVGSLRATSRRVCVMANGVRSSWEALAANLCCSATCVSSLGEHGVEGVGEFAELISAAWKPDSM